VNDRARHILLICDRREDGAAAVREHIDQLITQSRHFIRPLNVFGSLPRRLDLSRFDGLILHYSVMADPVRLLSDAACARIAAFAGPKAVFVQDEHRNVRRRVDFLKRLNVSLLFTCVPEGEITKVYPTDEFPTTRFINVLTGFTSNRLAEISVLSFRDRPVDVGYRGREVPAWLGQLGQEKTEIARRFASDVGRYGLRCDISVAEHERIYGPSWITFLSRCKATLGTESGASVFDPDGLVERNVESHLRRDPNASFDTLRAAYFLHLDGKISNGQVSPRIFEATALRTLMILYPGHYSGVVSPWKHYVPLAKDHSNMDEVVEILRDSARAEAMILCAYNEVALNPEYGPARLVARLDTAFDPELSGIPRAQAYTELEWQNLIRNDWLLRLKRAKRVARDAAARSVFRGIARALSPRTVDLMKSRLKQVRSLRAR
jgi:uncharacterized protein (DUF2267 family)